MDQKNMLEQRAVVTRSPSNAFTPFTIVIAYGEQKPFSSFSPLSYTHSQRFFPNHLVDHPSRLLSLNWTCDAKRNMKAKQQWALTNPYCLSLFLSYSLIHFWLGWTDPPPEREQWCSFVWVGAFVAVVLLLILLLLPSSGFIIFLNSNRDDWAWCEQANKIHWEIIWGEQDVKH